MLATDPTLVGGLAALTAAVGGLALAVKRHGRTPASESRAISDLKDEIAEVRRDLADHREKVAETYVTRAEALDTLGSVSGLIEELDARRRRARTRAGEWSSRG